LLHDVNVSDTAPDANGLFGRGMHGDSGARLVVERAEVSGSHEAAVVALAPGTAFTIRDLLLRDVRGRPLGDGGHGLIAGDGAAFVGERIVMDRTRTVALFVSGAAQIALDDVVIRDTAPRSSDGAFGRAIDVEGTASVVLTRVSIERARDVAVLGSGAGATIALADATVDDTQPRCRDEACDDAVAGIAVAAIERGAITLERFALRRSALLGVMVARDGEVDLHVGEIAETPIGINVQVPDYDLSRLSDRVVFRNNGTNLDAMALPVPMGFPPLL
jgi:hypothetical protein